MSIGTPEVMDYVRLEPQTPVVNVIGECQVLCDVLIQSF